MSEHSPTYRGIEIPGTFVSNDQQLWQYGVDAAMAERAKHDELQRKLTLELEPRVLEDPTGDLWYETSPGYFTYGAFYQDAIDRAENMPHVNTLGQVFGGASYVNWTEDVLRGHYANDDFPDGFQGVREVTRDH